MGELIFNVMLLLFFCAMFVCSTQIEIWNHYLGARYWPMVLIIIAIILLSAKVIIIWRGLSKEKRRQSIGKILGLGTAETGKLLASFLFCFLYALFLPAGGFLVTTFLFAAGFSRILGAKKVRQMLLAGFCSSVPIFIIFVWGLNIRLPRGTGILYTISLWLERLLG